MAAQPPTGPATFAPFGTRATLALVNDEPVATLGGDILGTGRAAAQLALLLHASRASTPFTLAVDAGWGMGKSSLMRLVDAERLLVLLREGAPAALAGAGQAQPPVGVTYDPTGATPAGRPAGSTPNFGDAPYGQQAPFPEPSPLSCPPQGQPSYPPPALRQDASDFRYQADATRAGFIQPASSLALDGLRILWVGDQPGEDSDHIRRMRGEGARVVLARDRDEAEREMAVLAFDLLVVVITRDTDRSAGLDDLRDWRTSGTYTGRAMVFSSRITPERLDAAAELGASISSNVGALMPYVRKLALAPRSREPYAPAPPPSAAPPA